MSTADKNDGGAVPPTTHFAIKPCCLICKNSAIYTIYNSDESAECYNRDAQEYNENEIDILHSCEHFTLRDFGYPVRKVEVE